MRSLFAGIIAFQPICKHALPLCLQTGKIQYILCCEIMFPLILASLKFTASLTDAFKERDRVYHFQLQITLVLIRACAKYSKFLIKWIGIFSKNKKIRF